VNLQNASIHGIELILTQQVPAHIAACCVPYIHDFLLASNLTISFRAD
jgi:hypothetical protein